MLLEQLLLGEHYCTVKLNLAYIHRLQILRPDNKVGGGGVLIWKKSIIIPQNLKVGGSEPGAYAYI